MGDMTTIERDLIARAQAAPLLARTQAWAGVNSGTGNLVGVEQMAALLADAFAALPGELALVDASPVEAVGPDGILRVVEHGRHLHLAVRPQAPVQMLLTGHMDTVYPAGHAFQAVVERGDGTLHGPGTADMKGGLAIMLAALEAWEGAADAARVGYEVVINSDEETGSLSSSWLIAQAARSKLAALTYEPALADGTLAGARGGTGNFSLVVRGRAAHAGRNPHEGRNAVVATADLAVRLAAADIPSLTVNPARIDGGGPNNVVPDLAVLRVNFRPQSAAAIEAAASLIDELAADTRERHDVQIDIHGSFNRPPKPLDAGAERLFACVADAGARLGQPIAWKATGGVCDGNNIAACGVPVVDTMGARGGAIHSPDEYLVIDSLAERAALSALVIARIAEGRW
jgi:glutamate carboxypeptidase